MMELRAENLVKKYKGRNKYHKEMNTKQLKIKKKFLKENKLLHVQHL